MLFCEVFSCSVLNAIVEFVSSSLFPPVNKRFSPVACLECVKLTKDAFVVTRANCPSVCTESQVLCLKLVTVPAISKATLAMLVCNNVFSIVNEALVLVLNVLNPLKFV